MFNEERDFAALAGEAAALFDRLQQSVQGLATSRTGLQMVTTELNRLIARAKGAGIAYVAPFPGARVARAQAFIHPTSLKTNDAHLVAWGLEMYPGAQHGQHPGDVLALGSHGFFDLYLAMQGALPATLIARYGSGAGDYHSHNPTIAGNGPPWAMDALFRCEFMNLGHVIKDGAAVMQALPAPAER